jgi:hypothetical protein
MVLIIGIAVLSACNPIYVNQDYDTDVDFEVYRTYSWVDSPVESKTSNPLLKKRIRDWADEVLAKKGLERVDSDPDLHISYVDDASGATEIRTTGTGVGMDRSTRAVNYEEGMMMVDMLDAGTNKLVWRGIAELTLSDNPSQKEVDKRTRDAIRKLLNQYPPG